MIIPEIWRISYSKYCDRQGLYPYHFEPIDSYHPYSDKWENIFVGRYDDALQELIKYDQRWQQLSSTTIVHKKERKKISPKLRFRIFKKYGYKCAMCGRNANDNITLHIDHIIPISKGGKSIEDNLMVLCNECNIGKGVHEL